MNLDANNTKMFDDRFVELASQHGQFTMMNVSAMGQKKIILENIDRSKYGTNMGAFARLPNVPDDWGSVKFAFDNGKYYILRSITDTYIKQPEFYDDWKTLGLGYHMNNGMGCNVGFFATPSSQRIYTKDGADITTYIILRSSFCDTSRQALKLKAEYPQSGITDDGVIFSQDPAVASRYFSIAYNPDGVVLGRAYPVFDADWAQKVQVTISVAKDTPKGLYIVSLMPAEYRPFFSPGSDVNYDAYKSKAGMSVVNLVVAVD
jgi:hypothetical protein